MNESDLRDLIGNNRINPNRVNNTCNSTARIAAPD
jgi:hypothetical protein